PEQFTSQAERDLIEKTGQNAILTAEVLSFGRLAHKVFSKKGIGNRVPLGDIGKSMALKKILLKEEEHISYFKNVMHKPGFIDQLGLTISEFYQYKITPETTAALSENAGLSHSTKEKLKDLSLIHRSYQKFLEQEFISSDETLGLLTNRLDESLGFENTEFWLDGFYGFTKQELDVIAKLLKLSPQVNITLTMDKNSFYGAFLPISTPFYEPYKTKNDLTKIAAELGASLVTPTILEGNKRAETEALKNLEKEYFYSFFRKTHLAESVYITACPNLQDEIRFAAGKILKLIREENIRYHDIAVVTNAMELYEKNMRGIFAEYDIPCFIDARRETASHPLVSMLTALLDILVYDFKYEAMFSYLKSGLSQLTIEEIDILENYVLAYGIKGYKWKQEYWDYGLVREGAEAIESINELRKKVMEPLQPFLSLSRKQKLSFHDFLSMLTEHLTVLQTAETMEEWANTAAAEGNLHKAEEYRQIWQLVMDVLEKAGAILGKEELPLEDMANILKAGMEKCTMGVIPPTADCLLIGDLERSRLPEIKYLFVLGVNEGILPSPATAQGIFTETERDDLLKGENITLANGGKRKIFEENFLIYRGLTKPSRGLWLTYAAADSEGKEAFPSSLIENLQKMDGSLKIDSKQSFKLEETAPEATFHLLGGEMRKHSEETPLSPLWQDIYSFFDENTAWKNRLEMLKKGIGKTGKPERLASRTAKALYGKNVLSSVSKLERYAGCPFSFFAEYGLKAEERRLYQLHTPDLGTLFHEVLELFSTKLEENSVQWKDLTKEKTTALIEACVDEAAPRLSDRILMESAANKYLVRRLKRVSTKAAWTLVQHLQMGDFVPAGYEVGFGIHEALPPIVIELGDGGSLILNGKIDRVDLLDAEGTRYLKIIDYKSGNKTFSFQDIYYGLQLQLLIYLDAYLKYYKKTGAELKPGGVFYFRIAEPTLSLEKEVSAEQIEKTLYEKMKMSGLLLQEDAIIQSIDHSLKPEGAKNFSGSSAIVPVGFTQKGDFSATSNLADEAQYEAILQFVTQRTKEIGEAMKSGIITPLPFKDKDRTPCSYCKYRSICRHDYEEKPKFRKLKKINKADFWTEIMPTEELET
ncbi:MAG: helicase-exonuclease AddAB subunit AddB, partial [Anaerotignum sp.]|nr:helicase-exonuclease AddAB subunit AddB [Anaerotignum sp.]